MWAIDYFRARAALATLPALCVGACLGQAWAQPVVPGTPRMDRLPVPATKNEADIAAIASGYEAQVTTRDIGNPPSPRLLIMVSFSMPPASLSRLAEQARRGGAVLVLNGLKDGSLTTTAQAVHQVFGKRGAPLQIDPRLFSRYAVNAVPTFVLLAEGDGQPCGSDTCPAGDYAKASGDVSLDYALEQIAGARPAFRPAAQSILRRLGN